VAQRERRTVLAHKRLPLVALRHDERCRPAFAVNHFAPRLSSTTGGGRGEWRAARTTLGVDAGAHVTPLRACGNVAETTLFVQFHAVLA
jgi:hypothetical protein